MCLILLDKNKLDDALKVHGVTLIFKDDRILFKSGNKLTGVIYLDMRTDKILITRKC